MNVRSLRQNHRRWLAALLLTLGLATAITVTTLDTNPLAETSTEIEHLAGPQDGHGGG